MRSHDQKYEQKNIINNQQYNHHGKHVITCIV